MHCLLPVEWPGEELQQPLPRPKRYEDPVERHQEAERKQGVVTPLETRREMVEHEEDVGADQDAAYREEDHRDR